MSDQKKADLDSLDGLRQLKKPMIILLDKIAPIAGLMTYAERVERAARREGKWIEPSDTKEKKS